MTDRWQAQYNFWASFGVPAYEEHSVPDADEVTFPYITYEAETAGFDQGTVVAASVWTRSTSWAQADAISDIIEDRLKNGGVLESYTGGWIWFTPEFPFSQNIGDPDDDRIKRKRLAVQLQFV